MDLEDKKAAEVVEAGLGSIGRIKILKILSRNREPLTKYAIAKQTGLRHKDLVANLRILVGIGWVEELQTRPIKYKVNMENEIVSSLVEFFYKARYI
jgi:predicted transcriptional regulator